MSYKNRKMMYDKLISEGRHDEIDNLLVKEFEKPKEETNKVKQSNEKKKKVK